MKPKRIIIAALLVAAVFYGASWLKGDRDYLVQLASTTMVRGMQGEAGDGKRIVGQSVEESDGELTVKATFAGADGKETVLEESRRIGDWTSLLPPLLAIVLAICLRRVLLSLALAIWLGAAIHHGWNPLTSAWYGASHYLWGNFVGEFSLLILGFVFVLVGMVNVVNRGGGMAGVVNCITKIAKSAKTACLSAACMGTLIFFDDYTNTIVVGTTMRSFTDRMRVSREKLAYIVDSTSAPLAGLAVISTWIGFEVIQLHKVADFLGVASSGYELFLRALPFRFYCIFTLIFVFMVCLLRRDFGPMLHAERRTSLTGQLHEPDVARVSDPMVKATDPKEGVPKRWYNAAIPVATVIVFLVSGIVWRGSQLIAMDGGEFSFALSGLRECFVRIGGDGDMLFVLMLASAVAGSVVAAALVFAQRILNPKDIAKAFLGGWRILPAALILIFAWSIQQVCDELGTALFLSSLVKDSMSPVALPIVIFVLSAAVAFATGTSFGTMGLLLPTVAPLAFTLGSPALFVMSLGSVLDGSIFGDHCSPLSDTTVLSSISSSCDLVDHVETQMPYAILCMIVAAGCGYLPAAMGMSPLPLYGIGIAVLFAFLMLVGRNPERARV
jgi:Na+/H+ antiporter NhaC